MAEDEDIVFYDGGPDGVVFDTLPQDAPVQEAVTGAVLDRKEGFYTVTVKSGQIYHFPAKQNPAAGIPADHVSDRSGNRITYVRNESGLAQINTSSGSILDVTSQNGLIQKITLRTKDNPQRPLVRYEYNGKKELLAVYDAFDVPYRFEYGRHGLTKHTDRNNLSFVYEYDESGRCVYTSGDRGLYQYRFEYLPDCKTRVTDSLGHVSILTHDENNLLLSETDPLGRETRYEYTGAFLTAAVIDPLGRRTEYAYNDAGDVTAITRPDGGQIRFAYDRRHNLIRVTDPAGNSWRQEWDDQGRLIKQTTPGNAETCYTYDSRGVIKSVTDANGQTASCKTDAHGNIVSVTNALGRQTGFEVDDLGNVLSLTDPAGNVTSYAYDPKGRLTRIIRPLGKEVSCGYDAEDNLTLYTDEAGGRTRLAYTGIGELSSRINPDGSAVYYAYDTEERLTGLFNERGELYSFQRDSLGRITRETDYWGNAKQYTWDKAGRLIEQTDALSRTIHYAYDPLDRLTQKTHASGKKETFAYDASGNLIVHENGIVTALRTFDPDGNVLKETLGAITVENEYDRLGNRIKRTSSHGNIVEYQYDPLGNPSVITINGKHTAIERNALGLPVKETLPGDHLTREYQYNPEGKLIEQVMVPRHSREFIKRQYTYDAKGNLTARKTHRQQEIGRQSVSDIIKTAFAYDACDRLIRFTNPEGKIKEYLYDKAGELQHQSTKTGNTGNTRREVYGRTEYLYDAPGNLIERKGEKGHLQLEWDEAGCLKTSINQDNIRTEYQYDAQRRRISKETNQIRTVFGWDKDQLLSYTENNKAKEIVYYPGTYEPFALIESPDCVYYYQNDHIGLPQEITNDRGQVYWSAQYDAQGNIQNESGVIDNPLRLQGQFFDRETGLCYNRHRYYDPDRSRFISQDPLGLAAGENLYAYAPNVWGWVDPLGLCKKAKDEFYHSTSPAAVNPIMTGGFRTDIPTARDAFHNNRFGRGVYLSNSKRAALAERPGGSVLKVKANLGKNLNITKRGPIHDADMAKSIARGARKHGYDSITTRSVQPKGGINTIIFNPANAKAMGVAP